MNKTANQGSDCSCDCHLLIGEPEQPEHCKECRREREAIDRYTDALMKEIVPGKRPTDDNSIRSWEEGHQNRGFNEAIDEVWKRYSRRQQS